MKNKFFKPLLAVLTFLTLSIPSALLHADSLKSIKELGVLKVAVPQDFPPFGSVGADFKIQGYDIDTASYLAKTLGVKLKLIPVTSANRIPYLQTNKVDLVISSMGKNPEREKAIDFSKPYAPFFLGVFGTSKSTVTDVAGLAGKKLGVTRGSVEDLELSKIIPKDAIIKRFEDNSTTISAYLSGQVELIATGNLVAAEIAQRKPKRKPEMKFMLKNSPCYVGMKKQTPELMKFVNQSISAGMKDGTFGQFSQKWFNAELPAELKK